MGAIATVILIPSLFTAFLCIAIALARPNNDRGVDDIEQIKFLKEYNEAIKNHKKNRA